MAVKCKKCGGSHPVWECQAKVLASIQDVVEQLPEAEQLKIEARANELIQEQLDWMDRKSEDALLAVGWTKDMILTAKCALQEMQRRRKRQKAYQARLRRDARDGARLRSPGSGV